jgi:predicted ATPase
MIKIDRYKVNHYRNIESADLELSNYNVVIGTNNSGKSNLIQSISFLNYIINSAATDVGKSFNSAFDQTQFKGFIPSNFYGVDETEANQQRISFLLEFSNTETERKFTYSLDLGLKLAAASDEKTIFYIDRESLYYKDKGKPGGATRIFARKDGKNMFGTEFKFRIEPEMNYVYSVTRILKILSFENEAYTDALNSLDKVISTPTFYFSHTELTKTDKKDRIGIYNGRIVAFDLEKEIIAMENSNYWNIFESALENILGITDTQIVSYYTTYPSKDDAVPERKGLIFSHADSYKSLNEFSDGTILIIALVTKILNSENDIFFIEEPENSTHPRALVDLVSFIKSFSVNKQFLITSHSIVLLNKSKTDEIITSCITSQGLSEIKNVSNRKELRARLKSGFVNFSDELFFGNDGEEFD